MDKYEIKSNLISNHKFNEKKNVKKIIDILNTKKTISLLSDAGTPCISDPGKIIINECIANGINVYPIPGASAVSAAASISGFDEKYFFYGFFPQKKKDILKDLTNLSKINCSIIFFVSPKKINKVIMEIKKYFSDRKILICREVSKFYEEYIRTNIADLEVTLVISECKNKNISLKLDESDKINIKKMIKTLSIKDIVSLISKNKNISKKDIYNFCLSLKK